MAKVKLTNKTLQVLNVLCKARKGNKTVQLMPKASVTVDRTALTPHAKVFETKGMISITAVENAITV